MANITALLRKGEGEDCEFKEAFGKDAMETLCAFANAQGGTLIVGVSDEGTIRGVSATGQMLKDWSNQIGQGIGIHPVVRRLMVRGKSVVVLAVKESRVKPVLFHGRPYLRVGSTTRQMNSDDIARAALASAGGTWDEIVEPRANLSDISMQRVRDFMRLSNTVGRRPVPGATSPVELLKKLGLLRAGRPVRAAVLLFGKEPQQYYSEALIKAGRFRSEALIVDDREIEGTLFDQVDGVMGYFRERLETRFERTGSARREVIWEYPLDALREAVVNAVCHRDYMSGAHTQVRLYDGRLEVLNPGRLPEGLSLVELKRSHESLPRNRLIAKVFYYAGLVERWGSGIAKMLDACKNAGLPEPVISEEQGFRIVFARMTGDHTSTIQVPDKYHTGTGHVAQLLSACTAPKSVRELMQLLGLKNRDNFMKTHLGPLITKGLLAMLNPESPNSPKQRYIVTKKGRRGVRAEHGHAHKGGRAGA